MQITLSEWQKPEHVKIIAPIIGVIFAVLFEIGFFSSIGLGWFTFFPLSNHIEFALESLPLALVMVLLLYFWTFLARRFIKIVRDNGGTRAGQDSSARARRRIVYVVAGLIFCSEIVLVWLEWNKIDRGILIFSVLFGVLASAALVIILYVRVEFVVIIALFSICVISSCCFRVLYGHLILINGQDSYVLKSSNGLNVHGVVLIAGDRGVLFLDRGSSQTQFWQWKQIEALTRKFGVLKEK